MIWDISLNFFYFYFWGISLKFGGFVIFLSNFILLGDFSQILGELWLSEWYGWTVIRLSVSVRGENPGELPASGGQEEKGEIRPV